MASEVAVFSSGKDALRGALSPFLRTWFFCIFIISTLTVSFLCHYQYYCGCCYYEYSFPYNEPSFLQAPCQALYIHTYTHIYIYIYRLKKTHAFLVADLRILCGERDLLQTNFFNPLSCGRKPVGTGKRECQDISRFKNEESICVSKWNKGRW